MIRFVPATNPDGERVPQRATPKNTGKTYPANGRRERIRRLAQAAAQRSPK